MTYENSSYKTSERKLKLRKVLCDGLDLKFKDFDKISTVFNICSHGNYPWKTVPSLSVLKHLVLYENVVNVQYFRECVEEEVLNK